MALQGSLQEFDLAEIFQLISRDSKTGQLVLSHEGQDAFVIFSQGSIVSAGNSTQGLKTMLFNYLIRIKKYSFEELNELFSLCQGELRIFTQELIKRNYIPKEDLIALMRLGIEDLACNLFLWNEGQYNFEFKDSVEGYIIPGVMFPTDAITMEAMRRSDEWKRMQQQISTDTVFTVSPMSPHKKAFTPQTNPLYDPVGYVASIIDGTSTVGSLCEKSFLFEYRLFEILFSLMNESEITAISVRKQSSFQQDKTPVPKTSRIVVAVITFLTVIGWIGVLVLGNFIMRTTVFKQIVLDKKEYVASMAISQVNQKKRIAILQYRSQTGRKGATFGQLKTGGYLTSVDVP